MKHEKSRDDTKSLIEKFIEFIVNFIKKSFFSETLWEGKLKNLKGRDDDMKPFIEKFCCIYWDFFLLLGKALWQFLEVGNIEKMQRIEMMIGNPLLRSFIKSIEFIEKKY